ncbi:endo-beta-N-acetylglucosaminidase [Spiroplasma endosymbiont of Stenodema calcarata]|uniref:endo-beta-N-acetylglucosaminidase n=1 Tax=Spiroplasma endosymbiont of Stenodema calcarata TaxID=3139328 RepID=UPI003CCB01ED
MKKLLTYVGLLTLTTAPAMLTVACTIGDIDGSNYLKNLPNFNWGSSEYGDGILFNNQNSENILKMQNEQVDLGTIKPQYLNSYLNYAKFSTGFQWNQNIRKQAVTGVPLNKGFMPNGNYAADFGVTSSAQKYLRVNSILNWDPATDYDAKYNQAQIPLQQRVFVATANSKQQNSYVNYNQLGFSSRKHRTFDNTIVGTKNPFENTNLNWQYVNEFVNWSGSWFEGPIIPPPADVIDAAHINGTPIYGNIFLDGYHGLTREMLKDFLARNNDGTYKIVDILINIAKDLGFDGWFINNEANGSAPNGTILDYNEMYQILKEFNYKVGTAANPNVKKLQIIYYRNDATVSKNTIGYDDAETIKMTTSGYPKNGVITPTQVQLNFGETPDKTTTFLKEHPNYQPGDLYTMIDEWTNAKYYGTYDFRQLAYALNASSGNPKYDPNVYTSFSSYMDNGTAIFGNYAYNWIKQKGVKNDIRAYLFATQVSNLFNMIHYSGTNTFISDNDTGLQANKLFNDYSALDPKADFTALAFVADPRIKVSNKGPVDNFIKQKIYDYQTNGGYNSTSFGVGSLVREKTTLFDENQILNKTTNFSMGSGIKFVDRDEKGNSFVANAYPWTNRRLTDILPTYQWKIYDETKNDQPLNINEITGMYDYDTVYKKGNSIAIGSGFDKDGKVLPAKWDQKKVYDWDIMGTNLINNNHQISFIYYDGSNNNSNAKVNFWITKTNQTTGVSSGQTFAPTQSEQLTDGWIKVSFDLSKIANVDKANRI